MSLFKFCFFLVWNFFACTFAFYITNFVFAIVLPTFLRYPTKVLLQAFQLTWTLFIKIKWPSHIIVQVCNHFQSEITKSLFNLLAISCSADFIYPKLRTGLQLFTLLFKLSSNLKHPKYVSKLPTSSSGCTSAIF